MSFLDLTEVKEQSFEPVKGSQRVQVVETEVKQNNAKTGKILKLKFKVIGGEFDSRTLFHNFNIENPNAEAVSIAKSELKNLLVCSGKPVKLESPSEIMGAQCGDMIDLEPDYKDKSIMRSKIKYFKKMDAPKDESESVFG